MGSRELPCPYRIIDDFGGAFGMGCFAGCIGYFLKGCWYSPKKERLYGGIMLLKKRAPILGGNFALWGGIFQSTNCSLIQIRQKDDFYNAIAAGFITGGLLSIRAGKRIAFRSAVFGGIILACISAVEIGMMKYQMKQQMLAMREMQRIEIEKQTQQIREMRPDLFKEGDESKSNLTTY